METVTVQPRQSMQDVILMGCGTLEGAMAFCRLNNVALSDTPVAGTVNAVPVAYKDDKALKYMADNEVMIGTLSPDPVLPMLELTVVLRPVMDVEFVPDGGFTAYLLNLVAAEDFLNVNDLVEDWLIEPAIRAAFKSGWDVDGDTGSGDLVDASSTMASKALQFVWVSAFIGGEQVVFYSKDMAARAIALFQDVEGNRAVYAPFLIYDVDTTTLIEMVGTIAIEVLSATSSAVTVRLTPGHSGTLAGWSVVAQELYELVDGMPVALTGETDGDSLIVELAAGAHEIGINTLYESAAAAGEGPNSYVTVGVVVG